MFLDRFGREDKLNILQNNFNLLNDEKYLYQYLEVSSTHSLLSLSLILSLILSYLSLIILFSFLFSLLFSLLFSQLAVTTEMSYSGPHSHWSNRGHHFHTEDDYYHYEITSSEIMKITPVLTNQDIIWISNTFYLYFELLAVVVIY